MTKVYGLFIDGKELPASDNTTFPVYAPEDGALVGHAAKGTVADVNRAVVAARAAFLAWSGMAPADRELVLLRSADYLEQNADRFIDLVIDESGSTIGKAEGEVTYGASLFRAAAGEARRLYGDTFPNDKPHRVSIVIREPLGVVAAISPFNAPLVLLVKMICFALGAGNTVIAKPSEETPLVAVELARVLHESGLPPGVFNVVTGLGPETGAALVDHPDIDGIAFTGSTATGIKIAQTAVTHMHRMQMELGGNNPMIVLNDADPVEAAAVIAVGAFSHAGQICMSSARIIAEKGIARPFAEALARKSKSMHLGDLRDRNTAYGPLINQRSVEKVQVHVDSALEAGAELLAGGHVHHGNTFEPTVLWQPPHSSRAWCEETFGPVASIVVADDLDHAIEIANNSAYGLSAAVYTNDMQRGMQAARRLRCGSVHLGTHSFQSDAMAPIGGYGMSGFGRSGGKFSVDHFTELKWISFELGDTPRPF